MSQGQEDELNTELPCLDRMESWATGLLTNLIDAVARSLAETPPDIPEYVESQIEYKGRKARIRVEFE